MDENILLGRGQQLIPVSRLQREQHQTAAPEHQQARLGFMTPEHHRVRYHAVKQLPITGAPLTPETIAAEVEIPLARVETILDELEKELFFLVRNEQGEVAWAFPVTVEPTPHRLRFSTGEQVYAA